MTSVFRPAALLLAGRSFGFLAAFGIPIFLARVFTISEFGTYKQVFLIYGTLLAIAQIGMAESLYYFLPSNHDKGGRHAANTLAVLGVAGLVCLALVWLGQNDIGALFNNPSLSRYLPLLGAFLAFSLAAILLEITMTARKRFRAAAGTYAVSEVLRAGFFLVPVAIFGGIEALLWGAVAFGVLRFIATFVYLRRHFGSGLRPDWHVLREQFAYALPFAAAVTIEVIQGTLHLYAVGHYFAPTEFAIFAVGCLQIPLVNLVMTSTSNVMMVRMQELRSEGLHDQVAAVWNDTTVKLSLLFMPLVAALLVLSNPLITLLYTQKYAASIPVFMVSTGMIVLTAIMTDSVLRVYAQTRYLVVLNLVRLGVVAGTILAFMSLFGITGAVAATVLATLVFKLLGLIRMRRILNCSLAQVLPWGPLVRAALISTAAALPALAVKLLMFRAGLAPIVVLLVVSAVYSAAYLVLFRFFAPLSRAEKATMFQWLWKPLDKLMRASGGGRKKVASQRYTAMKCQLLSTLEAGRRMRGMHAYPVIWMRAASRYLRWYLSVVARILRGIEKTTGDDASDARPSAGVQELQAGDWVRVKSRTEIEAQQAGADISDVVAFIPAPMSRYCGRTLRVLRVLEHYYDEVREGLCRAENAVLLEGATCDSSQLGNRRCDRGCLHFWKESWLERTIPPEPLPDPGRGPAPGAAGWTPPHAVAPESAGSGPRANDREFVPGEAVRVKDAASIAKTLDARGICEGVPFVPEHMTGFSGRIFVVNKVITQFFDEKADYMIRLPRAYLLTGVHCNGHQAGGDPDCDRGCALVWHGTWLERAHLVPSGAAGRGLDDV